MMLFLALDILCATDAYNMCTCRFHKLGNILMQAWQMFGEHIRTCGLGVEDNVEVDLT